MFHVHHDHQQWQMLEKRMDKLAPSVAEDAFCYAPNTLFCFACYLYRWIVITHTHTNLTLDIHGIVKIEVQHLLLLSH